MSRTGEKRAFTCDDGMSVEYDYYPAALASGNQARRPTIVVLCANDGLRGGIPALISALDLPACQYFYLSADVNPPGANNIAVFQLRDRLQQFVEHLRADFQLRGQDMAIISHNDAANVVASWIITCAPTISAVLFFSPRFLFQPREVVSTAGWRFSADRRSDALAELITTVTGRRAASGSRTFSDLPRVSWRALCDRYQTGKRIYRDLFAWHAPTLIFTFPRETRESAALQIFCRGASSAITALRVMPGADSDPGYQSVLKSSAGFLRERFSADNTPPSQFMAWRTGVTRDEYDRLSQPPAHFPARLYWRVQRLIFAAFGRLAGGIKVGLASGFDSGVALDYIYKNQPSGDLLLGKLIDAIYLNNVSWHCIRLRERHVEALLVQAVKALTARQQPVRILDPAAGRGRYILNTIKHHNHPVADVLMRDFDGVNVQAGQAFIAQTGLEAIATFEHGDAFSSEDLATLPTDRTVTIVSGFYELFSDNRLIQTSLNGIASATEQGGYLIYTTQLWNPRLAYMARVLTRHEDQAHWLLRRRTQLEIDQLVAEAGFEKVTQLTDPWGMLSVCLARKAPVR